MSRCDSPFQLYPRNPDGTCHYWKRTDADGTTHAEPQCTYWLNEAYRSICEALWQGLERQHAEQDRIAALTPQERAAEEGRLF